MPYWAADVRGARSAPTPMTISAMAASAARIHPIMAARDHIVPAIPCRSVHLQFREPPGTVKMA